MLPNKHPFQNTVCSVAGSTPGDARGWHEAVAGRLLVAAGTDSALEALGPLDCVQWAYTTYSVTIHSF